VNESTLKIWLNPVQCVVQSTDEQNVVVLVRGEDSGNLLVCCKLIYFPFPMLGACMEQGGFFRWILCCVCYGHCSALFPDGTEFFERQEKNTPIFCKSEHI